MALQHSPKIVTNGLIFHHDYANTRCYPGSGTAVADLSNNGYVTATMENNTSFLSSTNLGCMDFTESTQDSIKFHDDFGDELNGSNNWTLIQWLNPDAFAPSTGSSNAPIMFNLYGSGRRLFFTMGDGGAVDKIHMRGQIDSTWQSPVSSATLSLNNWFHIVFTYNASTGFKAYTNGVLGDTSSVTGTPNTVTSSNNRVGSGFSNRLYNGKIAVASLYNKELTAAEVLQNYNALRGRFGL